MDGFKLQWLITKSIAVICLQVEGKGLSSEHEAMTQFVLLYSH